MSRQPNEEGLRKVLDRLDKDKLDSVGYGKPASLMEDFPVLREYIAAGLDVQKAAQRVWCEKYNPKSPVEETTPQIEVQEPPEETPQPEGLEEIVVIENGVPVQTAPKGEPQKPYWNPLKKLAAIGTLVAVLATGLVGGYKGGTYLQQKWDNAVHQQQIEQVYDNWAQDHEQWNAWAAQQSTRDYKPGELKQGDFKIKGKGVFIDTSFDGYVRRELFMGGAPGEFIDDNTSAFLNVGPDGPAPPGNSVSYIDFNTSQIPNFAKVVSVELVVDIEESSKGKEKYSNVVALSYSALHGPKEDLYTAMENGRRYARIPLDSKGTKAIDLGAQACLDLERRLSKGQFSIGIGETSNIVEGDVSTATISSSESGQVPRLYVRYIIPKK